MTPTQPATITEATARQLMESIHGLEMLLAVTTEKLQNQAKWNDDQEKMNLAFASRLAEIDKIDVATNERIKYLEGWKNWLTGVLTAELITILAAVIGAVLYMTYGGGKP